MYHNTSPHIIEGADITALHDLSLEKHPSGKTYAHMTVELRPDKSYDTPDAQEHLLHITDGVSHRLLPQLHDYKKSAPKANGESKEMTLDDARDALEPQVSVKGHKAKRA